MFPSLSTCTFTCILVIVYNKAWCIFLPLSFVQFTAPFTYQNTHTLLFSEFHIFVHPYIDTLVFRFDFSLVISSLFSVYQPDHILSTFEHSIGSYVEGLFNNRHITLMTKVAVSSIEDNEVNNMHYWLLFFFKGYSPVFLFFHF